MPMLAYTYVDITAVESDMILQSLPFFANYWHYLLISLVSFLLFNTLARLSRVAKTARKILEQDKGEPESLNDEQGSDENDGEHLVEDDDDEPALPKDLEHVPYVYTRPSEEELIQRAREFYLVASARRTIRFFSPDPVPKEVIQEIVKSAGTAPSGAHTEPWTFVAVSDPRTKAAIREIVEKEEEINYKKRMGKKWTTDLQPLRTDWIKEYLTIAPYLILVFKQMYSIGPEGKRKIHYYNEMSVSIACGILLTAIQSTGLVTLTSTPLNCGPALRKLLNRPASEKLTLLLPVGYPARDATVPNLRRKSLSEILVEI
ncbi:iodotyrosine deiodinase 1 isoform X1 [Neodiprion fabricii]|uniref:iodotyrosine deiodinase 1 isoform X1 n=3 Tax=Neodiprion fabricii TaxID=2872261 RepID=UPI001ED9191D|nr:iodotyrosine deiodinase 1 isoform X1 [Neodiprion fabricii]